VIPRWNILAALIGPVSFAAVALPRQSEPTRNLPIRDPDQPRPANQSFAGSDVRANSADSESLAPSRGEVDELLLHARAVTGLHEPETSSTDELKASL